MHQRTLGRSNIRVSEIGLGGHREGVEKHEGLARTARFFLPDQQRAAVIARAIDRGITYFDTTFGCEIESLGRSLRLLGRRDGLFVSAMRVDFFANWLSARPDVRAYARSEFESRLAEFNAGPIDQFILGAMEQGDPLSHPRSILDDALDELFHLRDRGLLRTVGFSCHDPDYAARLLLAFPAFDCVMVPYNFANRKAEGALCAAVRQTGAALIAMKTLVWHIYGLPVTVLRNLRPAPGRLDVDPTIPVGRLAHQFILANPLASTFIPAANSADAVDEDASASEQPPLTESDQRHLVSYAAAMASEDFVPLAIAGLLEDNLRVRANAIQLLKTKLGWECPDIDWSADDAELQTCAAASDLLARVRNNPRWAVYLPS